MGEPRLDHPDEPATLALGRLDDRPARFHHRLVDLAEGLDHALGVRERRPVHVDHVVVLDELVLRQRGHQAVVEERRHVHVALGVHLAQREMQLAHLLFVRALGRLAQPRGDEVAQTLKRDLEQARRPAKPVVRRARDGAGQDLAERRLAHPHRLGKTGVVGLRLVSQHTQVRAELARHVS